MAWLKQVSMLQQEVFRFLSLDSFIVGFDFHDIALVIARWMKNTQKDGFLFCVVQPDQHDGHVRFLGDIVESPFPLFYRLTGAFRGDGQLHVVSCMKLFREVVGQRGTAVPFYRDAPDTIEKKVEREEKPLRLDQEVGGPAE